MIKLKDKFKKKDKTKDTSKDVAKVKDAGEDIGADVIQKPSIIKKLAMTGQLTRLIVYISSIVPTVLCIIFALLSLIGIIQPLKISSGDGTILIGTPTDFIIIALLVFCGVYGMYEFSRLRRVHKIDNRFPDFIRDLAESRRAGMTLQRQLCTQQRVIMVYSLLRFKKLQDRSHGVVALKTRLNHLLEE